MTDFADKKDYLSPYHRDPAKRAIIDHYLQKNASLQANLGTDSTDEERLLAKRLWVSDLLPEIAKQDPEFAHKLHAQDD
tara:strand:- start:296 stop:532 length:237 start_codon:yes stop_codon:yes gene_type:complete